MNKNTKEKPFTY